MAGNPPNDFLVLYPAEIEPQALPSTLYGDPNIQIRSELRIKPEDPAPAMSLMQINDRPLRLSAFSRLLPWTPGVTKLKGLEHCEKLNGFEIRGLVLNAHPKGKILLDTDWRLRINERERLLIGCKLVLAEMFHSKSSLLLLNAAEVFTGIKTSDSYNQENPF